MLSIPDLHQPTAAAVFLLHARTEHFKMGFLPEFRVPRTFKSLVVNNEGIESSWANEDILPVSKENQTYTWKAYCGYW